MKVLEAKGVKYYSQQDEKVFFAWLDTIRAIKKYYGKGRTLYLEIDERRVREETITELIALFRRYRVSTKQLGLLQTAENMTWMKKHRGIWT